MTTFISRNSGTANYEFKLTSTYSDSKNQGITKFSMPEENSSEAGFIRFSGQSREISFDFIITKSDSDTSMSTAPSSITTVWEQRNWLMSIKDYSGQGVFTANVEDSWTLISDELDIGCEVGLKEVSMNKSSDQPLKLEGSVTFIQGKNML